MIRFLPSACRRLIVAVSVLGALSSLFAAGHVHADDGSSPSACSVCILGAHGAAVSTPDVHVVSSLLELELALPEAIAPTSATLFRARGRAPPALASSSHR